MNNITIGIVGRDEFKDNITYQSITKNNLKYLHNKCNYIGIINYNNNDYIDTDVLKLCDGIIIQGGKNIYNYHFNIIEYAINNNIPLFGICMGHQIIGLYSTTKNENDLVEIDNHNDNKLHKINIKENSILYKLFGNNLYVNSRHLYKLDTINKPFNVSAYSDDNVIESIEYIDDNHFILGVQWHPEDMKNMESLYNYFIKEVISRKNNK